VKTLSESQTEPPEILWDIQAGNLDTMAFQEAIFICMPAAAQLTPIHRLRLKNKGALPYIPLQAGYRSKKHSYTHIWLYASLLATLPSCSHSLSFISLLCCFPPLCYGRDVLKLISLPKSKVLGKDPDHFFLTRTSPRPEDRLYGMTVVTTCTLYSTKKNYLEKLVLWCGSIETKFKYREYCMRILSQILRRRF
jgi:hypothetical protein